MEIDAASECLDDGDNPRLKRRPGRCLKIEENRSDGATTKIAQEPALELEKTPQHLGNRKDHLTMRDVEKERLPHPLTPLLKTLGVAGGTKSASLAGKRQQMFRPAARAADPGESAAGIAAVQIALDNVLDDRPEIPVFPLEAALIFRDKPLEMMKKHPIEDGAFRMARMVDSRHIGNEVSRNTPETRKGRNPGTSTRNGKKSAPQSVENRQRPLTRDLQRNGWSGTYDVKESLGSKRLRRPVKLPG